MALVYATRNATMEEVELFRRMLSTFRDGSGIEREDDGSTRAGWRQIERCVSALLRSTGGEDKGIFDVVGRDDSRSNIAYGFSVKSKQLAASNFSSLSAGGQVYMEIANSPAKFWGEISRQHQLNEDDFRNQRHPAIIGNTVISTVERWHVEGAQEYQRLNPGTQLDLTNSCYFCLSYSKKPDPNAREYQIHVFPLSYPKDIIWRYKSAACLSGYVRDSTGNEIVIIDWYGLSGGQLKYYPPTTMARFASPAFTLYAPQTLEDLQLRARNTIFVGQPT